MKLKLSMLTLLLPFAASAQKISFCVAGHIGKLYKPGKVCIDYTDNGTSHEYSCVVNIIGNTLCYESLNIKLAEIFN
ncbi:hypothetical protein MTO98_08055 [Mucilaginibacter sp. SMC90]|uniref:hypothetical protein n=1 Tax=Mucilaginibacter sp. SMC90 TaxID=2929803 RepID=UPI001FB50FF4|nr:hypothetical protein [Mucilaginibacter sp. SMC90]UOE51027.1 hypothetical protein MTO98_08055 [Mucilaginibacter sp. SMC90]